MPIFVVGRKTLGNFTHTAVRIALAPMPKSTGFAEHSSEMTKGAGGLCIPPEALQRADILVSTTDHMTSAAIRAFTASTISHAALYIGNGHIVDATKAGVKVRPLLRSGFVGPVQNGTLDEDARYMIAFRHGAVNSAVADRIVKLAVGKVNAAYDTVGATVEGFLSQFLGNAAAFLGNDEAFYCSELVAWAYREAGLPIAAVAKANTPGKLVASEDLRYLGHVQT